MCSKPSTWGRAFVPISDDPIMYLKRMHDFKGNFRKNHVQPSITLPECMTLPENLPTTIFSVKLMHLCIQKVSKSNCLSLDAAPQHKFQLKAYTVGYDFTGMHDLTGKFAYDDFFRKTHAPLYLYMYIVQMYQMYLLPAYIRKAG